jgi:hypothetical protein
MKAKKLGLVGLLTLGAGALVTALSGSAKASLNDWGYLDIKNNLNSKNNFVSIIRDDEYFPEAKDGVDSSDYGAFTQPIGYPNIFSNIPSGYNLSQDARSNNSTLPYDIKLGFEGTLTQPTSNWLEFTLLNDGTFGDKPMIFYSNDLKYGRRVDVKKAITQNLGRVDLIDVNAGTYNQWTPYNATDSNGLTIGTRLLADLNDDGKVNFKDYSILANDFGKAQDKYVGDIVGANGIPDGYVNNYDLETFCGSWMADVNDPNSW